MANKFPKTYHTGTPTQYENSKYNLRTEANEDQYTTDNFIDTYKFAETADDDSPEESFVMFVIKNTGSPNSQLSLNGLSLSTSLVGSNNPFSIVDTYDALGDLGQAGLHTVETLPTSITSVSGYVALSPTPLGYTVLNSQTGLVGVDDFGGAALSYIPFYSPTSITAFSNKVGNTSTDYGTGSRDYPHYLSFLIRCNPALPLEITAGEVVLQLIESTGNITNINLVMESYNIGNLAYSQGWLRKDSGGNWSFTTHTTNATMTPLINPEGAVDTAFETTQDELYITNPPPSFDPTKTMSTNFHFGYFPIRFDFANYNSLMDCSASHSVHNQLPAVKIWDDSATGGGIQFMHSGQEVMSTGGADIGNVGQVNTTSFLAASMRQGASEAKGSFYVVNGNDSSFDFGGGDALYENHNAATLSPSTYYYLVFKHDVASSPRNMGSTNANFSPYLNAFYGTGTHKAFRAHNGTFPVYHKNYFVNPDNNGKTQVESLPWTYGRYLPMGLSSLHHSMLRKRRKSILGGAMSINPTAWADFDTNGLEPRLAFANDIAFSSYPSRYSPYLNYRGLQEGFVTKDCIHNNSILTPVALGTGGGGVTNMVKQFTLNDYFVLPQINADGVSTSQSTVMPSVCWQNFTDEVLFNCPLFPWTPNTWNNSFSVINGSTTTTPKGLAITITAPGIDGSKILPSGYYTYNTGGVATGAEDYTSQAGDSTLLTATDVFADHNVGFEDITLSGVSLKQKSIRLATEFTAGTLIPGAGFQVDPNSTEAYGAMNWGNEDSGDQIGRHITHTKFEIKQFNIVGFSSETNTNGTGLYDSDLSTPEDETIEFSLYAHQWPLLVGDYLSIVTSMTATNLYISNYANSSDTDYTANWATGDELTSSIHNSIYQSNTIGNMNGNVNNVTSLNYKYSSIDSSENSFYKKLPLNGSATFKYERYFNSPTEASPAGLTPHHSRYGILAGPRRPGRVAAGATFSAGGLRSKIFESDLSLNVAAGFYEASIKLDFIVDPANSDYSVQIVNIHLENEMLPSDGDVNGLGALLNPRYRCNNGTQTNEVFELPLYDTNVAADQIAAPLTQFFVSSVSLDSTSLVVDLGTPVHALGIRVSQLVSSGAHIPASTSIVATSGNTITLSALPNTTITATLTFDWLYKNYARWGIAHGNRYSSNNAFKRLSRGQNVYQFRTYASDCIRPFKYNTTPTEWAAQTWNEAQDVGALEMPSMGSITHASSFNDSWTAASSSSSETNSTDGVPHIYLGIDRAQIEANNQEDLTFYNQIRVKYIVHNKLDNYGVAQERISGTEFGSAGTGRGHSFQTGAGDEAHVYEDTYLVKMNLTVLLPELSISDVEGDVGIHNSTIDFGTISSD